MCVYFQFEHDASPCQDFDLVDEIVIIIVKVDLQDLTGIGAQEAAQNRLQGQDRAALAGFPDFFLIVVAAPVAVTVGGSRVGGPGEKAGGEDKTEKNGLHGGTLLLGHPAPCRNGPDWNLTKADNRLSGALGQNAGRAARGGPCKQRTEPMISLTHLIGAAAAGAVATAGFAGGAALPDAQALAEVPARYDIDSGSGYTEIRDDLRQQGFDLRGYEQSARRIEVKGLDASGQCVEVYFHPTSGEELRRERDDDCGLRGDDDDDDRYDDDGHDDDDHYGDDDDRYDDDGDDR
jgi:Peptidase propeptide and YPEB domain